MIELGTEYSLETGNLKLETILEKVRINDLARELEIKSKAVIDYLPTIGVNDKKSHSSSLDPDLAERVRKHFAGAGDEKPRAKSSSSSEPAGIKTKIDLSKDARLEIPPARFLQWRAVLKPSSAPTQIESVAINYLSKNVAPAIEDIVVHPGARFQPPSHSIGPDTVSISFAGSSSSSSSSSGSHSDSTPSAVKDKSYIAVRWAAHDDNDDELVYSLYYRGENESEWKLLKSGLSEKFYSFESALLPDGAYYVKVAASDAPSHTPEDALSEERRSNRFEIDNTAPKIENLSAKLESQQPSGIVNQALSFQNVGDALGQSDALGDGCRCQRIRRRDYCAQHQADFPFKSGKYPLRTKRHSDHSERDQPKSQKQYANQVVGKFAPGRFPGSGVKKWRKDYVKNDIRIQCDSWNPRNDAEQRSANDEDNGVRNF